MDWTNKNVLRFLELYQMNPCIWDPKHASHKDNTKVNDAWSSIKNGLQFPGTIKELKKKRESLMSAYRGYKTKIKKSEKSGTSTDDVYRPSWFAFQFMDSFLASIYICRKSINTQNDTNPDPELNLNQDDQPDSVAGADVPRIESGSVLNASFYESDNHEPSTSQHGTKASKRRQHDPPELQRARAQMNQAFNILKTASQRQFDEDDECNVFGRLVAKKLRRLSVDQRDLLMIKMNELIYKETQEQSRPDSSPSNTFLSYPSPLCPFQQHRNNTLIPDIQDENSTYILPTTDNYNRSPSPLQQGESYQQQHQKRLIITDYGSIVTQNLMQQSSDHDVLACQPNMVCEGSAKEFILPIPLMKKE